MARNIGQLGGEEIGPTTSITTVAIASFIGTTIEWYDFFLYGTAAALVFNKLFFPEFDPLVGTLAAFGTYAVGFLARPIVTLLIMGIATFLVGLMPTYEQIGVWAAVILVLLRLAQGFGVGGEWGGAVLMAVEHAPAGRRGFYGSWPQTGVPAGLLLSTLVFSIFSSQPEAQFLAWGWRVPFLLSFILVIVGMFIRLKLAETPAFARVKETQTLARMPILDVIRTYPKNVLLAMGARIAENGFFYIFSVFVLSYVTQALKLPRQTILNAVLLAAALELVVIPAFGALSDRIGRRPVYLFGAAFAAIFSFPFFWLLDTKQDFLVWLAVILGLNLAHGAMYGPQASFFSELFGTRVRYSGASLGYQLASVLAGGLSPIIATALLAGSGGSYVPIAIYMIGMAVITLIAVYIATETVSHDIAAEQPEERRLLAEERGTVAP
jgi:MFS family permease